ncbi:MAG: hypothetical protein C0592_09845 [Marinilabiliales bacterium]|mgnify:CR=1 FL=1|nr:MAG: hypothetical protein C0592_09845 [Marinilabiliales bacterium]
MPNSLNKKKFRFDKMPQRLKIGIRFNCDEEESHSFWQMFMQNYKAEGLKTALIDLSGRDLLFNAISCVQAENREEIYQPAPRVINEKCKFCGKCIDYCKHNAISMQKGSNKVTVIPEACTDCGKCYKACSKKNVIVRSNYLVGLIEWTERNEYLRVLRVAFRKKSMLKKKGLTALKKHTESFNVKIYSIDSEYCGKSVVKKMDRVFEVNQHRDIKEVFQDVVSLISFN